MSKTKVAIIHHIDPFGKKVGGIFTYIKGFVKYAPKDFEIKLIGITENSKERKPRKWHRLPLEGKKIWFYPLFSVKDQNIMTKIPLSLKFSIALWLLNPEVDDSVLFFHRPESALPYLFRKSKNKKILCIHSDIIKMIKGSESEVRWRYFPWFYLKLEKLVIPKMSKIYVINRDSLRYYLSTFPCLERRFQFLPTWVDFETFYPLEGMAKKREQIRFLRDYGFRKDERLITFVGRLEKIKSPLLLLDAFNYAFKRNNKLRLIVIGEGRLRKKMEGRAIHLGIRERISFMGELSSEQVGKILRIANLFLLTSWSEGMPISVLEALASGIPMVRDGFSGRVVKERTPDAIGNAILEVLNGKDYSTKNCLISVADFTPQKVLKSMYDTMREISRE